MRRFEEGAPSGLDKAATLLATVGQSTSAEILKHLSDDEIQRVSQAVAKLDPRSATEAEAILAEFDQMVMAQQYVVKGGIDYAREMLRSAFGAEVATRLLQHVEHSIASEMASLNALQKADPQQLAKFIHNEHPQTVALVLAHLAPQQAAALLTSLPRELRTDVAVRMANLDQISPDVVEKIASVIEEKLRALGEFSRESHGGVRAVADMVNRLEVGESREIMTGIETEDAKLFEMIRHLMFVFEDLGQLDLRDLKELIQRVDRKQLTIALKGTSDQLKTRIMSVMSQRSAEMLREDIEVVGAIRIREVEAAQQHIIALIREMEKEGVITLQQSQYVV